MERAEALRRVSFLKTLSDEAIAAVATVGEERVLQKGELLFAENAPCIGLLVVLTGAMKVYKIDDRGRDFTLAVELPGASVAELPLFDGGNYPASAEAAEDRTIVFVVSRERFRAVMAQHPEIAEQALRALALRMRQLVQMVEAQTLHSVRARLAAHLLHVSAGRATFPLPETNEAMGSRIGTVRDVVSRTLRGYKEAGMVSLSGRSVTILDRDALRRVADRHD